MIFKSCCLFIAIIVKYLYDILKESWYYVMCNHCTSNGNDKEMQEVKNLFLSRLAETSSEISEMKSGLLSRTIGSNTEVYTFGSIKDILSNSRSIYLSVLDVALEQVKTENSVESLLELYTHLLNVSMFVEQFMDKVGDTQLEILNNLEKGK